MKVFIVLASLMGVALCDKPLGGYGAPPVGGYGAPSEPLGVYAEAGEEVWGPDESVIPGVPGTDYPIFNEVPETSFTCVGKVEGGYYADPEADCQAFHICAADGQGGLIKMSALCHNGTIFNQEIFTCDLWANFNCADAEGLYSKNEELAAAREEVSAAQAASSSVSVAAASGVYGVPVAPPLPPVVASLGGSYGAPVASGNTYESPAAPEPVSASSGYSVPVPAPVAPSTDYGVPVPAPVAPSTDYGVPEPVAPSADYGVPVPAPVAPSTDYGVSVPVPRAAASGYGAPLSSYAL